MYDGSTSRRITVVANPKSGNSNLALDAALTRLQRAGTATIERPEGPGGIARAVEAARAQGHDVVLAGGDGTVNAALGALRKADRPFGLLPMGTANDLARTLGIPTDLEAAADIIAAGHVRRIDMSTVNGHPFVNVASIGLAVEVALRHRGPRKRRLGVLNYPLVWWEAYRAMRPFRVRITCDQAVRDERCIMLAVGNGRHYGGGLTVHEDAWIDDGQLTLYFVKSAGSLQLMKMLPAFLSEPSIARNVPCRCAASGSGLRRDGPSASTRMVRSLPKHLPTSRYSPVRYGCLRRQWRLVRDRPAKRSHGRPE